MFAALTTLEDVGSEPDVPTVVEPVDVLDATDTDSDEEMPDRREATTRDLPGPELRAIDPRGTRAASELHNSIDDTAVSVVSATDLAQSAHNMPLNNGPSAPVLGQSRLCRVHVTLAAMFGNKTQHWLTQDSIEEIIRLGDCFLRVDIISFLEFFRHTWPADGLWDRQPLSKPTHGQTRIEKLLESVRCADILECDSAIDSVRLRMARVILYHHYEQLCIDLSTDKQLRGQLSSGRNKASLATDMIFRAVYGPAHEEQVNEDTLKQYRGRLQNHKKVGKRWCMLASHLGLGILLVCHRDIGGHM
jgi:hypothetical protein